jgi:sporulation protein YlmC with PRC-barrel domain
MTPRMYRACEHQVFRGTRQLRAAQPMKIDAATGTAGVVACFLPINFISGRTYMLAKYMTASVAASALLATVAFAQTPNTNDRTNMAPAASSTSSSPAASSSTSNAPMTSASASNASYQGDWRTSKIVGLNVYNDNNESIGSINDLLTDKNGNIKAVVIGVGGFLGVGEHLVAVAYDQLKFVTEPVAYKGASNAPAGSTSTADSRPASTTTTGAANTTTAPAPTATTTSSMKANPWYPDHAVLNTTKDQLKAMPEFKYST